MGTAADMGTGFAKGIESTTAGVGSLLRKGLDIASATNPSRIAEAAGILPKGSTDAASQKIKELLVPKAGLSAEQSQATPHGVGETIGYGGETLTEFLLGDEALKGLSLADRLKQASQVAGIFEKSPRLMKALQMGADVSKAMGELGPEERIAIQKSPVLAHLVSAGMDAIRQGAVQGAQTLVRSGGDVGQAAKEGGAMAGVSMALGAPAAVVGGLSTKTAELGKTLSEAKSATETAKELAKTAGTHEELVSSTKSALDSAKQQMHNEFESGIQDLTKKLQGTSIPNENSPIASRAKELLKAPEPAEHELVSAAKEAAGERLDKPVKSLISKAASSTQPWTANDLIDFRQSVRKLADSYDIGDTNARVLRKMLPSVDDTIDDLAKNSGDPGAAKDYQNLRTDYKDKIKYFDTDKPEGRLGCRLCEVVT